MSQQVTIQDIAQRSGTSPSTVSLVLRNKPGVGEETRNRVLATAQALGYQRRPAARRTPSRDMTHVGLLFRTRAAIADASGPAISAFLARIVVGIELVAQAEGIRLSYATVAVDEASEPLECPALLREERLDGVMVVGLIGDRAVQSLLPDPRIPVVVVDASPQSHRYDTIVSDHHTGAYTAVSHLIEHGHRRIGLVGRQQPGGPNYAQRRDGYLRALRDHGIAEQYIVEDYPAQAETMAAATAFLQRHPEMTAVFGWNDLAAVAAVQAAQSLGRRIPDDLSIVGFDDADVATQITPQLTTMQVDRVAMGRSAVQLLRNRLEWPDAATSTLVLQPRLVERQSVARR